MLIWIIMQELEYYATEFSRNGLRGPCMSYPILPHSHLSHSDKN